MSVKHIIFAVLLGISVPVVGHADTFSEALDTCTKTNPKNELQQYRCMETAVLRDLQYHPSALWASRMWLTTQVLQLATKKANKQITDSAYDAAISNVTNVYSQISALADMADKERSELEQKAIAAAKQSASVANTGIYNVPRVPVILRPPLPTPSPQEPLLPVDEFSNAPKQAPHRFHRVSIPTAGFAPAPALPPPPAPGSLLPKTYNINTWGNAATITGPNGNVTHCMGGYGGTVTCN